MTAPATADRPPWKVRFVLYGLAIASVTLIPATMGGLVGKAVDGVGIALNAAFGDNDQPIEISPTNPPVVP